MTKTPVNTCFIRDYKLGDNIKYNTLIVEDLYQVSRDPPKRSLNKPKFIFNIALVDAALFDFYLRVKQHTNEFQFLSSDIRKAIQDSNAKKHKTFEQYIGKFRHHRLLGTDEGIYTTLTKVRKLRNKVHIQTIVEGVSRDEEKVFDNDSVILSERITEYVLKYLSETYPREADYVGGFELPWAPHFNISSLKWT
jgi:hypothetical protein